MAVRKCKTCIGSDIKEELLVKFPHLKAQIEDLPECDDAGELVICQGKGKGKSKRPPSKYNTFMGGCLNKKKGTAPQPEIMKSCAIDWKTEKAG